MCFVFIYNGLAVLTVWNKFIINSVCEKIDAKICGYQQGGENMLLLKKSEGKSNNNLSYHTIWAQLLKYQSK